MTLPKTKKQTLPEIRVNIGIIRSYHKQLNTLIREMRADVNDTLVTQFKAEAKREKLAMDGISDWVGHVLDMMISKWQKKLNLLPIKIAEIFVNRTAKNYDTQMNKHLRDAGFTVKLQLSPFQQEALQASIKENVTLIRSINSKYFDDVQTSVWQCIQGGYDLGALSKDLEKTYGITKRRAAFIARDQGAKAHAVIERARRQELGITKAIWLHSHAGKVPRPSHLKADGQEFEIAKGMYLDGKWVLPGQEPNCRCGSRAIIDGL